MTKENILEYPIDRLPMKNRNFFQITLMQEMGIKHKDVDAEVQWAEIYSKIVSDIIDNKITTEENDTKQIIEKIRKLITEGTKDSYLKACILIKPLIEQEITKRNLLAKAA